MKKLLLGLALLSGILYPNSIANAGDGILIIAADYSQGYNRNLFKHWIDADKDGCDTRAEVLIEEAIAKPKIGKNCKITGGKWISSYDGKSFKNSGKLDIDHLVPLAEAWRSGAWSWTDQQRLEFANDLDSEWSLNAVTASVNRTKGDKDISSWLPTENSCNYLKGWVITKSKYSLSVDPDEAVIINENNKRCGLGYVTNEAVPTSTPTPTTSPTVSVAPSPSATPTPTATLATVSPGAFCAPAGATGNSANGTLYTCKSSATDTRNRWRQ